MIINKNMVTRYIFVVLVLFTSKVIPAQEILNGVAWLDSSEKFAMLSFSKNGTYELQVSNGFMPFGITLSTGKYLTTDNKILLTDNNYGFQMQMLCKKKLICKKNKFLVQQSFRLLIGETFDYWDDDFDNDLPDSNLIYPPLIEQERKNYNNLYTSEFPLKTGVYKDNDFFRLTLFSDSSYILELVGHDPKAVDIFYESDSILCCEGGESFNAKTHPGYYEPDSSFILEELARDNKFNQPISSGTWSRNHNELILHDTGLEHDFYMLIGEGELTSKLLPGDYDGVTLYHTTKLYEKFYKRAFIMVE